MFNFPWSNNFWYPSTVLNIESRFRMGRYPVPSNLLTPIGYLDTIRVAQNLLFVLESEI